ncbi:hypothetical protein MLD38_005693 [Melastoma candidum]|uniref:Uncharacterized protein n=1 Tax=Melastoma candidum TaxID=119954 RepID=A0ACB9RL14_9MYRT|nr:hypothetical protein MLD38_005693 [Melastoma candidum]
MEGETSWDASSSGSDSELPAAEGLIRDEDDCSYSLGSASKLQFRKATSKGRWIDRLGMTEVIERKGQIWTTTGIVRDGNLYCSIDETLYLMEIGALSLVDEDDLPLSLEGMYERLAREEGGYSWVRFEVYRYLKSLGYIIGRYGVPWRLKSAKRNDGSAGDQERKDSEGIYSEQLLVKEFGNKLCLDDHVPDFDVHLPNGRFRKSSPGDPNFLLRIARGGPPSRLEIDALERKNGSIPLKFCQVDNGRVSFFSFSKVCLPALP